MRYPELPSANEDRDEGIFLSEHDAREAARLFKLLASALGEPPAPFIARTKSLSADELALRAKVLLHSRRRRTSYFNRAIFGEPAWEILLLLYVAEAGGARQTPGRLADWLSTPLTTIIRWIDYLEKERLVERQRHPTDKRASFIILLAKGRSALDEYLAAMPWLPLEESYGQKAG